MKNTRFSDARIIAILKQAESGVPVSKLCRKHGMSSAAFYPWRATFGGMDASMISESERCAPLVQVQWRARWPKKTVV